MLLHGMPSIAKNTSVEIVSIVEIESVGLRAGGIFLKSCLMFSTWLGDGNGEGGGNNSEGDDDEGDDSEGDDDDSEGDGDDVDDDSDSESDDGDADGDGDREGEGDCVGNDDGAVLAIAVVTNTDDDAPLGRPG